MSPASKGVIIVAAVILGLFIIVLLVGEIWTLKIESDPKQKVFATGYVPSPLPNGFYRGQIQNYTGAWLGKSFESITKTGLNNFKGDQTRDPFAFYTGEAVRDKKLQVLKIDYNIPENTFWVRHILDEIVETTPGHYLGKIHVRLAGLTFTFGYFELIK